MKSGIELSLERINAEIIQLSYRRQRLDQEKLELSRDREALVLVSKASACELNLNDEAEDKQNGSTKQAERIQEFTSALAELEERWQLVCGRLSQLYKVKESLEIQRLQENLRPRIQDYLTKTTGISWIEEAKYGEGKIVSEPFDNLENAKQFHDLFRTQVDNQSTVQKSPRGEYYRVFANKDSVLDSMVENELHSGHAMDKSYFFQILKDSISDLKKVKP